MSVAPLPIVPRLPPPSPPQQGSMIAPQAIIQAVGRGDVEAVRAWLEAGGDASALSERGTALICFAACTSGARMVKLLLTAARPAKAGYADAEAGPPSTPPRGASSRTGAARPRWPCSATSAPT